MVTEFACSNSLNISRLKSVCEITGIFGKHYRLGCLIADVSRENINCGKFIAPFVEIPDSLLFEMQYYFLF